MLVVVVVVVVLEVESRRKAFPVLTLSRLNFSAEEALLKMGRSESADERM